MLDLGLATVGRQGFAPAPAEFDAKKCPARDIFCPHFSKMQKTTLSEKHNARRPQSPLSPHSTSRTSKQTPQRPWKAGKATLTRAPKARGYAICSTLQI